MSFKTEVIEKLAALITAAFGLVAALAWNGAIQGALQNSSSENQSTLVAMFVYAVVRDGDRGDRGYPESVVPQQRRKARKRWPAK